MEVKRSEIKAGRSESLWDPTNTGSFSNDLCLYWVRRIRLHSQDNMENNVQVLGKKKRTRQPTKCNFPPLTCGVLFVQSYEIIGNRTIAILDLPIN